MKKISAAVLFLSFVGIFSAANAATTVDAEVLKLGKTTYELHCARCHGEDGKGNGMDARRLPVAPRNFTRGAYKFRTTASGTPPSDADLLHTLNQGLTGSGMPSFANLSNAEKDALIQYIKSFSAEFSSYEPQPLAAPNTKVRVDLAKGKEIYAKLGCALCHGDTGQANGSSAATLTDTWGDPIQVANLTQGWTYRGGNTPTDIYYRLMAGLAGTPMPSYAEAVQSPDEAWQLANYVKAMQLKENWSYEVIALENKDAASLTVESDLWKKVTRTDVNLDGWIDRGGRKEFAYVKAVSVQAVTDGKNVTFRLFWSDPSKSEAGLADQVLVAFKQDGYKGDIRDNLHNTNLNAGKFKETLWRADRADSIGGAKAQAQHSDGLWSLLFTLPLPETRAGHPAQVGFAIWDGGHNEAGDKAAASVWIPLYKGEKPGAHH